MEQLLQLQLQSRKTSLCDFHVEWQILDYRSIMVVPCISTGLEQHSSGEKQLAAEKSWLRMVGSVHLKQFVSLKMRQRKKQTFPL